MRDYTLSLKDILAAIESIEGFAAGMNLEMFQADDKTSSAVLRKLEAVGEAANQIPDEIRQKYSCIQWNEMAGMRDKLINFHFCVDHLLVWNTIIKRLPQVKQEIRKILQEAD